MEGSNRLLVGMMCEMERSTKFKYACAAVARMKNADFFYFTPNNVDLKEKRIHGFTFENDEWVQREFEYPQAIYDKAARRGKLYSEIYKELGHIPMTTDLRVDASNKLKLYEQICEDGVFPDYFIPTQKLDEISQVFEWLDRYRELIIKPIRGSQGKNVIYLRKQENEYVCVKDKQSKSYSQQRLLQFLLNRNIANGMNVIQPFIRSVTKEGNPYDIRIHLTKNEQGTWSIVKMYPRIGAKSGVTSNISGGGYIADLQAFYEFNFDKKSFPSFRSKLRTLSLSFAKYFQDRMEYRLNELGLDIGIDANGRLWFYEVNVNRLGSMFIEFDVAKYAIEYTIYLAKQQCKLEQNQLVPC